jgi:hypothetical protein
MSEQSQEEKAYIETRGGEAEPKPEAQAELPLQTEKTEVSVEAEAEAELSVDKPNVTVPYSALKEERTRRKKEQEEKRQLAERLARLEGELNARKELAKPPEQAKSEEQIVPWDQDPKKAHEQLLQKVDKIVGETAEQSRQRQYTEAHQRFQTDYRARVTAFAGKQADFPDAYNFLAESRTKEYQAAGYSEEDAQKLTWRDEERLALDTMMKGKNPAEVMYEIAKTRGYQAKAAPSGNGAETLKTVERGQKVAASLGAASGAGTAGPQTLEAVLALDEDEFAKVMADENKRAKFWARHGG